MPPKKPKRRLSGEKMYQIFWKHTKNPYITNQHLGLGGEFAIFADEKAAKKWIKNTFSKVGKLLEIRKV